LSSNKLSEEEQVRVCKVLSVLPLELLEKIVDKLTSIMKRPGGYGQVAITTASGHISLLLVTYHERIKFTTPFE
jgi:hypothetical protein